METRTLRRVSYGVAVVALLAVPAKLFAASAIAAPEIDGNSIAVGLAVLTAGVMILRARRSK